MSRRRSPGHSGASTAPPSQWYTEGMTEPRDSHLSSSQLTELRTELEHELVRLRRSMASTAVAARPVELDQTAVGRVSRADALQNQQLSADLPVGNRRGSRC
jgi:hypothetical protein